MMQKRTDFQEMVKLLLTAFNSFSTRNCIANKEQKSLSLFDFGQRLRVKAVRLQYYYVKFDQHARKIFAQLTLCCYLRFNLALKAQAF